MLAQEHAEEELKEQGLLPTSGKPKAPEVPFSTSVSVEDQVGSSASTELEFGSDGRPLHEPEGSIFPTNSHESDKTVKRLLTGLHREANSRFQGRSLLLEDLKGLGMAGDLSDDSQFVTMPFEDVHRLVTTMRMAEIIRTKEFRTTERLKLRKSRPNLTRNIALT